MVTLPKISLGKKSRRAYFDKQHDVNTTADFGFCQPTLCEYLPADTKISFSQPSFVRLAPMPCPTFGRVKVNQFTRFVNIHDVFEAFDYQQSQQTVQSAIRSYVPQKADVINNYTLLGFMLCQSMYASRLSTYSGLSRMMFRMSVWSSDNLYMDEEFQKETSSSTNSFAYTGYKWKDIINDSKMIENPYRQVTGYEILNKLCTGASPDSFLDSPLWKALKSLFNLQGLIYPQSGSVDSTDFTPLLRFFATDDPARSYDAQTAIRTTGHWPNANFGYNSALGSIMEITRNDNLYYPTSNMFSTVPANLIGEFQGAMSLENADFIFPIELSSSISYNIYADDDGDVWKTGSCSKFMIGLHLTTFGKKVMKVLTGCGFQFRYKKDKSMLPLLSYYKAWFDEYNAGRDIQWRDTACYKLIHNFYDSGTSTQAFIHDDTSMTGVNKNALRVTFFQFLADLSRCVYCLPIDNITCATSTPLIELVNNKNSIDDLRFPVGDSGQQTAVQLSESVNYGYVDNFAGGLGIKILERVYHLMNKNSVIGARVDEYLKTHFGFGLPESPVIGRDDFLCDISDVLGTVNNDDTFLGEFAGRGIGGKSPNAQNPQDRPKVFKFETKEPGYVISMCCVVPLGGYVQGVKDEPISRYDFYQSEYDSLGMQPLTMDNVYGRSSVLRGSSDATFGFVPRYFPLKVKNNLANGGFSLRSQRAQFLPYSLDRLFDEEDYKLDSSGANLELVEPIDFVADETMRYIGLNEQYGNFDRIFYDASGRTDNFIIHFVNDFAQWSPMKPVVDSYDTFDDDIDDSVHNVSKS